MEISLSNCVLCVRLYVSHANYFAVGQEKDMEGPVGLLGRLLTSREQVTKGPCGQDHGEVEQGGSLDLQEGGRDGEVKRPWRRIGKDQT